MDTWRGFGGISRPLPLADIYSSNWLLPSPHLPGAVSVGALCARLSQRPAGWVTSILGDPHQSSTNASGREDRTCAPVMLQSIVPAPLRETMKLFHGWWKAQILQEYSAGALTADLPNRAWLTPEPRNLWRFLIIFTQEEFISFSKMLRGFLSRTAAFRLPSDPGERCTRPDSLMRMERRAPLSTEGSRGRRPLLCSSHGKKQKHKLWSHPFMSLKLNFRSLGPEALQGYRVGKETFLPSGWQPGLHSTYRALACLLLSGEMRIPFIWSGAE